jgi:hypothetical protein
MYAHYEVYLFKVYTPHHQIFCSENWGTCSIFNIWQTQSGLVYAATAHGKGSMMG